jgi:nitrogen fixation protein FixH
MACVFVVNGWMVFAALHSFPGTAGDDGFDLSNRYGRVLEAAAMQTSLGWQLDTTLDGSRLVLQLTRSTGEPLGDAEIEARALRPVGPEENTPLPFRSIAPGRYETAVSLASGQWDILVTVRAEGQHYSATRRVILR